MLLYDFLEKKLWTVPQLCSPEESKSKVSPRSDKKLWISVLVSEFGIYSITKEFTVLSTSVDPSEHQNLCHPHQL